MATGVGWMFWLMVALGIYAIAAVLWQLLYAIPRLVRILRDMDGGRRPAWAPADGSGGRAGMAPISVNRQRVRLVLVTQYTYWASVLISALSVRYIPPGSLRVAVMLTPLLTALFCVCGVSWLYRSCDEYIRLQLLRCVASTAVIVTFCTLAYFFLELAGYPHQSMLWVNLLGWSVFNVQVLLVVLRSE